MQRRFVVFVGGVLAYNLGVIMWGAFVRATGSGAGCGNHWPLCNGQVIPRPEKIETMIELAHRLTSVIAGFLVIGMLVWAVRAFPRGHLARRGAWLSFIFIIIEGLLGAALVRLELVTDNASVARAVAMGLHLINTLILLAVITLTAWWGAGGAALKLRGQGATAWLLGVGLLAVMIVGVTGAITALGDTLFPPETLRAGLEQDLDPTAHFLIRLRVWHPAIAIATGIYIVVATQLLGRHHPAPTARTTAAVLLLLFGVQVAIGTINVVLLAPVAMQLIHLLLADLVWVALVILAAATLVEQPEPAPLPQGALASLK